MAGWWLVYVGIPTPLKNMKVIVSWDDDIPNIWKVIEFHGSSHHQADFCDVFVITIPQGPMVFSIQLGPLVLHGINGN